MSGRGELGSGKLLERFGWSGKMPRSTYLQLEVLAVEIGVAVCVVGVHFPFITSVLFTPTRYNAAEE
jgi:hypothetical protein